MGKYSQNYLNRTRNLHRYFRTLHSRPTSKYEDITGISISIYLAGDFAIKIKDYAWFFSGEVLCTEVDS